MRLVKFGRGALLAAAAMGGFCVPTAVAAQEGKSEFNIDAGSLADALIAVGRQAGVEVVFASDAVAGKPAAPLHGNLSAQQALDQLLAGTGLVAQLHDGGFVIRGRAEASDSNKGSPATSNDIVVTGSRIRGSQPVSSVITATRDDILRSGASDLGEFTRNLPQNFSGGQNPGVVGGGSQGGNENLTSSSTLNLRGLGPDATLTLINGHRVAYDGVFQGVDISAIPVAAIDRLEIVTDGSSALYGSDAVAGVANVVLRKDYDGLWTSSRFGVATNGGDTEEQVSAVGGTHWENGGFLATADYKHATAIYARQRDYANSVNGSATLLPGVEQFSAVVSGHQQLGDAVRFDLDGQYSHRTSTMALAYMVNTPVQTNGEVTNSKTDSFAINPTIIVQLPSRWELTIAGTHAESLTNAPGVTYQSGALNSTRYVRYKDTSQSAEAYLEGPLFHLPGGDARLVAGGGYRTSRLTSDTSTTTGNVTAPGFNFDQQQKVAYAFGEVSLPFVSSNNSIPLVSELRAVAAARYESYKGIDSVTSPKIGLVYRPMPDLALKGSWGKSFKAPTLYDQYRGYQSVLLPASYFGASNAPAGGNVLYLAGANSSLKPERATTWTVTASATPSFLSGFKLDASYFSIRYRDRVATPITSLYGTLSNPIYGHFINSMPTGNEITEISQGSIFGLENYTGLPYDPATVYAIVDNRLQNSARQKISGVDIYASYHFNLSNDSKITLNGSATYIQSTRQLTNGLPSIAIAGTVFNIPHWRAQGGATWDHSKFTISAYGNYIGGTEDNRLPAVVDVASYFSADIVGQLRSDAKRGFMRGFSVQLSINNLFDRRPSRIRSTSPSDPSYDSTNYSAIGRTVNFTISKQW